MRAVLAAILLTLLLTCFEGTRLACAQEPRRFPDLLPIMQQETPSDAEFQLPIQSNPPFNRPLGPPARPQLETDYVATWTSGVDRSIQQTSASTIQRVSEQRVIHSESTVSNAKFMEPAPLANPIPSPRPKPLQTAATFPLPVPGAVIESSEIEQDPDIPFLPPAPIHQVASPEPQISSGVLSEATDGMIAPPHVQGDIAGVPPPPDAFGGNSYGVLGDIGTDPFIQEAYEDPSMSWGGDSRFSDGYSSDQCPTPDVCGVFEPYLNGELRLGNKRVIYGGGFFVPLWQDCESLLFTDLKGRGDDHGAADGFFGLGYRQYLDPYWILGGYVYYDLRVSNQNNYFNQANIGIELLSVDWEFRINGYFPGSPARSASTDWGYSNGTLITKDFRERAYRGLDWEIGNRCLYWGWNDKYEVRWFVGGYHFDHSASGYPTFGGARGRLEMRIHDLGALGHQSRLEFGMEVTADRVRDGQVFGYARIQIPLGGGKGDRDLLDPLRRRMLDAPVRIIN